MAAKEAVPEFHLISASSALEVVTRRAEKEV